LSAAAVAQFLYLPLPLQIEVLKRMLEVPVPEGAMGYPDAAVSARLKAARGMLTLDVLLSLRAATTTAILRLLDAWWLAGGRRPSKL
jgi:hypothetical protein